MAHPSRVAASVAVIALALTGCTAQPAHAPAGGHQSPAAPEAPSPAALVPGTPSGATAADVVAALPRKLGGRARSDNGTNPQQVTVGGKPATVHSYVYKGSAADDYVAVQVSATPEAAALFPAGAARLASPQAVAGARCGVGRVDDRQMNVCYALLDDGVLTVAEPAGKLTSLGQFTDRLSRAQP